ncbi:MAG: hypothetical protein K2X81_17135, partial [Candidatus Obscuribacterales bacterium]|nr:hypothetical protein [Candidatus Obscuribacterales bacterium]
ESGKVIDMAKTPSSGQSSWVVFKGAIKQPEPNATANWLRKNLYLANAPAASPATWTNAIRYGIFPLPKLVGEGFDLIPLWDGYYSNEEGLDFSINSIATGIVDGKPAAVAFVSYSTGGTGVFEYLMLYRKMGNAIKAFGGYSLEDRAKVNSLKILDGAVVLDCVMHKPEDPAPFPSLKKLLKLHQKDFEQINPAGK